MKAAKSIGIAGALCAALLAIGPAVAQEADGMAPMAEEVVIQDVEPPEEVIEITPQDNGSSDVWWGNRSISFGNYIKFDRLDTRGCTGLCDCCDENGICYATGLPCGCCVDQPCELCDGCRLPYFDKIFFDLDKSFLRPEGIEECERIVEYLNDHPDQNVRIEGHTCDLATETYNVGLGQRRANSVKKYLVDHGIDPARITTHSFGETRPWVGIEERELNRRAIVIPELPAHPSH